VDHEQLVRVFSVIAGGSNDLLEHSWGLMNNQLICIPICTHILPHRMALIIGASLSEPHTSETSLHPCVCKFVCLNRPLTVSHFKLLFCAFCVMHNSKTTWELNTWTMDSLAPWWQQQGRRSYLFNGKSNGAVARSAHFWFSLLQSTFSQCAVNFCLCLAFSTLHFAICG